MLKLIVDNDFPPRNLKTDEAILNYISENWLPALYNPGHEWFWLIYMPAVERAVAAKSVDDETIAGNYYVIGDVHETNGAYKTAIKYYKLALKFDPELHAAHREIACMYARLEQFTEAIYHSDQSLALHPFDEITLREREDMEEDRKHPPLDMTEAEQAHAKACEELAINDPNAAINTLGAYTDLICLRTLTWAHGANGDISAYLSTWEILIQKILNLPTSEDFQSQKPSPLDFMPGDIFFMPENVYSGHEIWGLWKDSGLEFTGFFTEFESLEADETFSKLSTSEGIGVKIEFYYYDNSDNLEGLKTLSTKYPKWAEVNEAIAKLET